MTRFISGTLALVFVAILSGCSKTGGSGVTPEATFESFKSAMQAKDYEKGLNHMTPDSHDRMLGGMAMVVNMIAVFDPEKAPEGQQILDKHGVKKMDATAMTPGQDPQAAMKQLTSDVKDKPACIAEILAWLEKNSDEEKDSPADEFAAAELAEVKIDGDTAMGTLKIKKGDEEKTEPVTFKKIDGVWLLELAETMGKSAPANDAAPPLGEGFPSPPSDDAASPSGDSFSLPPSDDPAPTSEN